MRGLWMSAHDFLGRFDSFHLWHGDVHEHDVRMRAFVLGNGGETVPGLARHLAAKALDHAGKVLARKDGVIDDQIANRLTVLATFNCSKTAP